ncbi:hypothetical protein BpHYR1_027171 [Brachionus plicatilis]|uniref:Uncharacterized protein n=1 Tax=Brachionus plicatilis TaxID=10195 RepID=A0A3M7QF69_BRAPC|nr:hypothetical protein BpHYR1_027171 [Brachionus plicatilis]
MNKRKRTETGALFLLITQNRKWYLGDSDQGLIESFSLGSSCRLEEYFLSTHRYSWFDDLKCVHTFFKLGEKKLD